MNSEIRDAGQEGTKEWIKSAAEEWICGPPVDGRYIGTRLQRYVDGLAETISRHVPVSAPVPERTNEGRMQRLEKALATAADFCSKTPGWDKARNMQAAIEEALAAPVPEPYSPDYAFPHDHKLHAPEKENCGCCGCPWRQCIHDDCSECQGKRFNEPPARKDELPGNPEWSRSYDAHVWAKKFVEYVRRIPEIATDEGTMIGWFANAIMAGYDEHARRVAPQASPEAPANAMDDFRSWYTQEGSAKFDEISQKHYEPDDCTDTQLIMQEVAELTWARARLGLSGRAE